MCVCVCVRVCLCVLKRHRFCGRLLLGTVKARDVVWLPLHELIFSSIMLPNETTPRCDLRDSCYRCMVEIFKKISILSYGIQ